MQQTILVYGVSYLLMFVLALSYARSKKTRRKLTNPYILGIIITYTLVYGFRYDVGVDHVMYVKTYVGARNQVAYHMFNETIWNYFIWLLQSIKAHYLYFFIIVALIQIMLLMKAFTYKKRLTPYYIFIFLAGNYVIIFQNGLRQSVALALILYFIICYRKTDFWQYALMTLLATLIHYSSIIMLVLYPLFYSDRLYISKRNLRISIYLIAIVLGYSFNIFEKLVSMDIFMSLVDSSEYSHYKDHLYMGTERTVGLGFVLRCFINCILFYQGNKFCNYFKSHSLLRWYNVYYYGTVINVLLPTSILMGRFILFMTIWGLPVFAYFTYYVLNYHFRKGSIQQLAGYTVISGLVLLTSYAILITPEKSHATYHFWYEAPYPGYSYYKNYKASKQ